jgi:hypothetical protein
MVSNFFSDYVVSKYPIKFSMSSIKSLSLFFLFFFFFVCVGLWLINEIFGKTKFELLPVKLFEAILDRLDDESDLRPIKKADSEPLYDQDEAEEHIFTNPVKRERMERDWTQNDWRLIFFKGYQ